MELQIWFADHHRLGIDQQKIKTHTHTKQTNRPRKQKQQTKKQDYKTKTKENEPRKVTLKILRRFKGLCLQNYDRRVFLFIFLQFIRYHYYYYCIESQIKP